jgi:hypothetical protein
MSSVELFAAICQEVTATGHTADGITDEITKRVKAINFDTFDIDDIKLVQDATWLPDDLAVDILKRWMRNQDQVLLKLRANLVVTPTIEKTTLLEFTRAIRKPSQEPSLIVEDVIQKLATAGGTREPVNPKEANLITATASSETPDHPLTHLFSVSVKEFFMSNSTQGQFIVVSLPPFLRLQLTSYRLGAPPKEENKKAVGGIGSWHLEGSNDVKNFQESLDEQSENRDLMDPEAVHVFPIADSHKEFYQHFKLTNDGQNHQNNLSILLSAFDLSGVLVICKGD